MAKAHNPRRAKIHRSYTVAEAAALYAAHRNTIRNWTKKGLATVQAQGITLILGSDLRAYLERAAAKTKQRCGPGQLFCLKCRAPKTPVADLLEITGDNGLTCNVSGPCSACGTRMFRRVALGSLSRTGFPDPTTNAGSFAHRR